MDCPRNDILLIDMGGLGDVCLSESTFFSLSRHFSNNNITALGYPRFLCLFESCFASIHSIQSRDWLYLFLDEPAKITWERIVFIGKDKDGGLRKRWQDYSRQPLIFVDMYPDGEFEARNFEFCHAKPQEVQISQTFSVENSQIRTPDSRLPTGIHVEDYQLMQLKPYGISATKTKVAPKPVQRIILYPEAGFKKTKWPAARFIELYRTLKREGFEVHILESLDLELDEHCKLRIENLTEVKDFFQAGGIFVSNDSGMAHFAGACGLLTITIFNDFDPSVWHPRGRNISLHHGHDPVDITSLEVLISAIIKKRAGPLAFSHKR